MNGYVSVKEASHKWEIPEHGIQLWEIPGKQKKRLIRASRNLDGRQTGVITDETIYQQYLRGETNAADLLVEKYADMLIFYINGLYQGCS